MKKIIKFVKKYQLVLLIIVCSLVLFSPALGNFFSGDDWFHLKIIQITSFKEFLNFFNPVPNEQSTAFYRPIPNQLFFYIFYQLFKLNAFFYHVFVFTLFAYSLYLFYIFLKIMSLSKSVALISLTIFAFSHTNFSRLYFLSATQEIMLSVFVLLALINSVKKPNLKHLSTTSFWYILALLSKDSAIVFPVLVIIFDLLKFKKINFKKLFVLVLISVIYLYIRIFIFGFNTTLGNNDSYDLSFSPMVTANTIYTYILWAVGGAELLKDYLRNPITLIGRFYTDFGLLGKIMIGLLVTTIISFGVLIAKNFKKISLMQLGAIIIFIISLAPVLFFPNHKFTIQMSMSMMGFALFIGLLLAKESKKVILLMLFLYLSLNITSILLTQKTHYSVQRAKISSKAYKFFTENYPILPDNTKIVFANSDTNGSDISTWGSSKQISHALMMDNFFKVIYPGKNIEVIYEDLVESLPASDESTIFLDSKIFLQN